MEYNLYFFPSLIVLVDFSCLEQRCGLEGSDFKILRKRGGKKSKKEEFSVHIREPQKIWDHIHDFWKDTL